jgi:hypothetical protein
MSKRLLGWMLVTAALTAAGCPVPYTPGGHTGGAERPPYARIDDLFVPEEAEGGQIRTVFAINNRQYWTLEGLTLWTVWGEGEGEFTSRTVTMGKSSGYSGGGYGMVFCQGEYEVNGLQEPAMLVVMVNNEGYYIIGKAVGGVFTDIGWWKETAYLHRGAGAGNEIKVSYEEESGEYRLDINGYFIERFRDDEEPALRSGKNGYIVVITPFDQFPQSAIAVYFTEER